MVDLIVKKRQLLQDDDTTAQCHVGARWGFWKSPAMFFYLRINTFLNIATKLSSESWSGPGQRLYEAQHKALIEYFFHST